MKIEWQDVIFVFASLFILLLLEAHIIILALFVIAYVIIELLHRKHMKRIMREINELIKE